MRKCGSAALGETTSPACPNDVRPPVPCASGGGGSAAPRTALVSDGEHALAAAREAVARVLAEQDWWLAVWGAAWPHRWPIADKLGHDARESAMGNRSAQQKALTTDRTA